MTKCEKTNEKSNDFIYDKPIKEKQVREQPTTITEYTFVY